MKVLQFDAEERIVSIASSIETDPVSWKDWGALQIEIDITEDCFQDIAFPVKAVVEAYLRDVEGGTYFCNGKNIYVICKHTPGEIFKQVQAQITDIILSETGMICECHYYDFPKDACAFAETVFFHSISEQFSIHIPDADNDEKYSLKRNADNKRTKILLVEDDAVTRWMVENALKNEYDINSADTASKVFSMYPSYSPHLVFLDIGLPDNTGQAVLEWIMRNDPLACVIMLSGKSNIDNISGCIEAGAKGFIPKPFIKESLLSYIRQYG